MTRTLLSSVFVLLALAAPRYSCPQARPSETSVEKKMDALFSGATSPDAPGLAVLVRQDGKAIFEHGYGVTDVRRKSKIDANTNFRLASFTKQFTAMATMLLVRDGKLRYNETLGTSVSKSDCRR